MTTTLTIDVGIIVAALAPTIAILVSAWITHRKLTESHSQIVAVHTLVNDAMTHEKRARLADLQAHLGLLESLMGPEVKGKDLHLVTAMRVHIDVLEKEIEARDVAALEVGDA